MNKIENSQKELFNLFNQISSNFKDFPLVFDVGARNGFALLPEWYTQNSELIGFEPNLKELEKLKNNTTDANKLNLKFPSFLKKNYFGEVVWNTEGYVNFHETIGPARSCVDLKYKDQFKKFFINNIPVVEEIKKSTVIKKKSITIDSFLSNRIVDFLKVDVEGGEKFVLEGATRKLKKKEVLCIKSEFMTHALYEYSSIISQQQSFLNNMGYRLVDITHEQPRYTRGNKFDFPNDKKLMLSGDLIFILDPDLNSIDKETKARLGFIMIGLGYKEFGFLLINESKLFTKNKILKIERYLKMVSLKRKLYEAYLSFPKKIFR